MNCPACHAPIPPALVASEAARVSAGKRKTHHGPPRKLSRCPKCHRMVGVRQKRLPCPHEAKP